MMSSKSQASFMNHISVFCPALGITVLGSRCSELDICKQCFWCTNSDILLRRQFYNIQLNKMYIEYVLCGRPYAKHSKNVHGPILIQFAV